MESIPRCIEHVARSAASARSADRKAAVKQQHAARSAALGAQRRPQGHYTRELPPPRIRHPARIRTVRFFDWCRLANGDVM